MTEQIEAQQIGKALVRKDLGLNGAMALFALEQVALSRVFSRAELGRLPKEPPLVALQIFVVL